LNATLYEYNEAVAGYWRNWERNTAWLMREIVYTLVVGNPNIPKEDKPVRSSNVYRIADDKTSEQIINDNATPTEEELQMIKSLWVF
jgi:hypothetical protein